MRSRNRSCAAARRRVRPRRRWPWSSQAGEEVVLGNGRVHRAAHPLESLQRPGFGAERLTELQEPAVFRDLGPMGPHRGELIVDEPPDVEPSRERLPRDGEGRRLAVGGEAVLHARPFHRLGNLPHHRFRKRGVVELARAKWVATREALHIGGVEEGADGHSVSLDVIGMRVATKLVLCNHHLGTDPAHDLDQPGDRFFFVGLPEGLRLPVPGQAGHARVLVTEEDELVDAEDLDRVAQLPFADGREPWRSLLGVKVFIEDLSDLATGRGDQRRPHTLRAVASQRSAHPDGFVVRVRLDRKEAQVARHYLPLRERTSWISCGTILWTSPTTPRSAILKIGASGSLLMAMIVLAPFIPTVCCMAPEMPSAMYTVGLTVLPVWPIWNEYGFQPASTTARLAPTAAPSSAASSSSILKFSGAPSPRPPLTMIAASSSLGPLAFSVSRRNTRATGLLVSTGSVSVSTCGAPAEAAGSAVTAFGRIKTSVGALAFGTVVTSRLPPNIGETMAQPPSLVLMSVALAMRAVPSRALRRDATSRPS